MTRLTGSTVSFLGLAGILAAASGCQQPAGYSTSGWLKDYPPMVASDRARGAYVWLHPDKTISDYRTFILDPVDVLVGPDNKDKGITQADLDELARFFWDEASAQILSSGKYKIVKNPGAGVLRIRTAITGVNANIANPNSPKPGPGVGGANMEAEFVDTGSNERIAVVVAAAQGNPFKAQRGQLGHTQDIMTQWAKLLRQAMDNRWISRESPW